MKIKQKNNKKRPLLMVALVIAIMLLMGAITLFYLALSSKQESTVDLQPPTTEQKEAGSKTKESFLENASPKSDSHSVNDARVIITDATQIENKDIRVSAIVQLTNATGQCMLLLEKGSVKISKTSPAIPQSRFTACADFNVPYPELSPGMWKLTVSYGDQNTNSSTSQEIMVN